MDEPITYPMDYWSGLGKLTAQGLYGMGQYNIQEPVQAAYRMYRGPGNLNMAQTVRALGPSFQDFVANEEWFPGKGETPGAGFYRGLGGVVTPLGAAKGIVGGAEAASAVTMEGLGRYVAAKTNNPRLGQAVAAGVVDVGDALAGRVTTGPAGDYGFGRDWFGYSKAAEDARLGKTLFNDPEAGAAVFHGTPHKWAPEPEFPEGRFRLDKIGTGEGAQAYGWGAYFAEHPGTARTYREMLGEGYTYEGIPIRDIYKADPGGEKYGFIEMSPRNKALYSLEVNPTSVESARRALEQAGIGQYEKQLALKNFDEIVNSGKLEKTGRLYNIDLPLEDAPLLDWDKPLSAQSEKVREAVKQITEELGENYIPPFNKIQDWTGAEIHGSVSVAHREPNTGYFKGHGNQEAAASMFREAGIPGLRYLDQGSRGRTTWIARHPKGGINDFPTEEAARAFVKKNPEYSLEAPNQTRNFVIWDQELLNKAKHVK